MHQLVQEQTGIDFSFQTLEDAKKAAVKAGIEGLKECESIGKVLNEVLNKGRLP